MNFFIGSDITYQRRKRGKRGSHDWRNMWLALASAAVQAQVTREFCYRKARLATTTKHEATTEAPGTENIWELSGALHAGDM
jgi:hypothetical protein